MVKKRKLFLLVSVTATLAAAAIFGSGVFNAVSHSIGERRCEANLAILHEALTRYLDDNDGIWPQGPPPDEPGWAEFWITALKPYGVDEANWTCPTSAALEMSHRSRLRLHYVPTLFDDKPWTAMRWRNQPWLIERIDAHSRGPLICFPDGSIRDYETVRQATGN